MVHKVSRESREKQVHKESRELLDLRALLDLKDQLALLETLGLEATLELLASLDQRGLLDQLVCRAKLETRDLQDPTKFMVQQDTRVLRVLRDQQVHLLMDQRAQLVQQAPPVLLEVL
jgi:hypothetical protein